MCKDTVSYLNDILRLITTSAAVFAVLFVISKPHFEKAMDKKLVGIIDQQKYISYILMESIPSSKRDSIIKKWKSLNEQK